MALPPWALPSQPKDSIRRAPHKSAYCEYCSEPSTSSDVGPQYRSQSHIETKTHLLLRHEQAQIKITDVADIIGEPAPDEGGCDCILGSSNYCIKCAPDKKMEQMQAFEPKICKCPPGAHLDTEAFTIFRKSRMGASTVRKKKIDLELWFEKYERERERQIQEKLINYRQVVAMRKREEMKKKRMERNAMKGLLNPPWYHKLSCQQVIFIEFLSRAIRLDTDENIIERTQFILGGIGLYPRPKVSHVKRCIRDCRYNSIDFLKQLFDLSMKYDKYEERLIVDGKLTYSANDKLIMASICHLELPEVLRQLMERLPKMKQEEIKEPLELPPPFRADRKKYSSPYLKPLWNDSLTNWIEMQEIERINRYRVHLHSKRVPPPPLVLVRRPSLIDARPPYLDKIEEMLRGYRVEKKKKKKKRPKRKRPVIKFDSEQDVTAIAEVKPSETDIEDICIFLRPPPVKEVYIGVGEEDQGKDLSEILSRRTDDIDTAIRNISEFGENSDFMEFPRGSVLYVEHQGEGEYYEERPYHLKTPPSFGGESVQSPCGPPRASPELPSEAYKKSKRALDILNKEACCFDYDPDYDDSVSVGSQINTVVGNQTNNEAQMEDVAKRLIEIFSLKDDRFKEEEKPIKRKKKRHRRRKHKRSKSKKKGSRSKSSSTRRSRSSSKKRNRSLSSRKRRSNPSKSRKRGSRKTSSSAERSRSSSDKRTRSLSAGKLKKHKSKKRGSSADKRSLSFEKGKKTKRRKSKRKTSKTKSTASSIGSETEEKTDGKGKKRKKQKEHKTDTSGNETTEGTTDDNMLSPFEVEEGQTLEEVFFEGDIIPVLKDILHDLAEEGYICASYPKMETHPDITQLVQHLKGEVLTPARKAELMEHSKLIWTVMKKEKDQKLIPPEFAISSKRLAKTDWNDRFWVGREADKLRDQFNMDLFRLRFSKADEFWLTTYPTYFETKNYLKMFWSLLPFKFEECIPKGPI